MKDRRDPGHSAGELVRPIRDGAQFPALGQLRLYFVHKSRQVVPRLG